MYGSQDYLRNDYTQIEKNYPFKWEKFISDYMDRDTWQFTENEITPFLSNYSNELYYYRGNNQYAKFQFNKEHQENFKRFKKAFNENSIPLNKLSLILLNVFYRFPYEILKKLKIYDIHQYQILKMFH